MKELSEFIVERITVIDKPERESADKIDLKKIGPLIEKAAGKDAYLAFSFKKNYDYTVFKIDTNGQLWINTDHRKPWSKTKDPYKIFNKWTMRMSETRGVGIVTQDTEILNFVRLDKHIDTDATEKFCEVMGIENIVNWRQVFNAFIKISEK